MLSITRGIIPTALGAIGYLLCDGRETQTQGNGGGESLVVDKPPIVCFHCSPRSSDEFLEALPLLAEARGNGGRLVIALDAPGYGVSSNPTRSCNVDQVADAMFEVVTAVLQEQRHSKTVDHDKDTAKLPSCVLVGNLMGNYHAISLASRYPDRIAACILANPFYTPTSSMPLSQNDSSISLDSSSSNNIREDPFVLQADGSHLVALHNKRISWLEEELNFRVVQSEITYLVNRRARYARGIVMTDLSRYDFETPAQQVTCPVLCVPGEACATMLDAIGLDGTRRFQEAFELLQTASPSNKQGHDTSQQANTPRPSSGAREQEFLKGPTSTLNMINQDAQGFATLCRDFLERHDL